MMCGVSHAASVDPEGQSLRKGERGNAGSGHDKAGRWRSAGLRQDQSESGGQGVAPEARRPPSVARYSDISSSSLNGEVTKSAVAEAASVVQSQVALAASPDGVARAQKGSHSESQDDSLDPVGHCVLHGIRRDPLSRKFRTLPPKG